MRVDRNFLAVSSVAVGVSAAGLAWRVWQGRRQEARDRDENISIDWTQTGAGGVFGRRLSKIEEALLSLSDQSSFTQTLKFDRTRVSNEAVRQVIEILQCRHEKLRARIEKDEGGSWKYQESREEIPLEEKTVTWNEVVRGQSSGQIDIRQTLWAVTVIRPTPAEQSAGDASDSVVLRLHRVICDQISANELSRDFVDLLNQIMQQDNLDEQKGFICRLKSEKHQEAPPVDHIIMSNDGSTTIANSTAQIPLVSELLARVENWRNAIGYLSVYPPLSEIDTPVRRRTALVTQELNEDLWADLTALNAREHLQVVDIATAVAAVALARVSRSQVVTPCIAVDLRKTLYLTEMPAKFLGLQQIYVPVGRLSMMATSDPVATAKTIAILRTHATNQKRAILQNLKHLSDFNESRQRGEKLQCGRTNSFNLGYSEVPGCQVKGLAENTRLTGLFPCTASHQMGPLFDHQLVRVRGGATHWSIGYCTNICSHKQTQDYAREIRSCLENLTGGK